MFAGDKRIHCRVGWLLAGLVLLAAAVPARDVTQLGVIPNDGLDDAQGIENAIVNNQVLDFPPGVYNLNTTLDIAWYTSRTLQGMASAGGDYATVEFRVNGDFIGIDIHGSANEILLRQFTVRRMTADNTTHLIWNENNRDVTLDSLRVLNNRAHTAALMANGSRNVIVKNCIVLDSQRFWTSPTQGFGAYGPGIRVTSCIDSLAENNWVEETHDFRYDPAPYGKAFMNIQSCGIELSDSTRTTAVGNMIIRAGQGIDIGGAYGCDVRSNRIRDIMWAAIKFVNATRSCTASDNYIDHCSGLGINVDWEGTTHNTVTGNIINYIGQGFWGNAAIGVYPNEPMGVWMRPAQYFNTITNNHCYNNAAMAADTYTDNDGVFVYEGRPADPYGCTVSGNVKHATGNPTWTVTTGFPPPHKPLHCEAKNVKPFMIQLNWDDVSHDERGFQVERSLDGSNWSPLVLTNDNVTSITDGPLKLSTLYYYRVKGKGIDVADSAYSNVTSAMAGIQSEAKPGWTKLD